MPSRRKKVPFEVPDMSGLMKASPHIQQLLEDPRLRGNIQRAIESSRSAYERLSDGSAPVKKLLDDKKVQADVRNAVDAIREAADALAAGPKKRARKGLTFGRTLLIAGIGGAAALAGSEELRTKVLDALFGAEQEFEYTPPPGSDAAAPPAPAPDQSAAPAPMPPAGS
jgi:hypothetical protein